MAHSPLLEFAAEFDASVASGDLSTPLPEQLLWTDESWMEGAATKQSTSSRAEEDSTGEEYFTAEETSEASLESVDSGGSGRNLSLERRQNGVPLVYLLQDEVLATIFALVVLSYYAKEYKDVHHKPSDQGAILAVCRRLRAIAMDLPVWTVVVVPTKFIRPFLRKGQPLDVIVDRFRPINMDNIASFELLRKLTCRVRTAKLILRTTLCSLSPNGHIENYWLSKEMPELRSLEVVREGEGWGDEVGDRHGAGYLAPFSRVTPKLEHLRITSFAFPTDFQGLSSMSLKKIRYNTSTRIAGIFEAIRNSPRLEFLCLEQVVCPPQQLAKIGVEYVPAQSLRLLKFCDVTVAVIHLFLAQLATAPSVRVEIDIELRLGLDLTQSSPGAELHRACTPFGISKSP
ncbi:hypothetical protein BOTBODRAFT_328581 [Botryobasidium botryosum FD-172 SS1]|uniref:F-box domain-containing protein n=1 Tax=Botryobasidium botryosum (strain FD-172 SS1) TaxID=930990 RepID=A0A067N2B0_BOTB1|nr:hypothetical protein BOTBODRAFT_328581 [Botryobasidium botryosum FD-172 SS1]